ncbi:hypothetical protein Tco_0078157 [Tanacetum coccineum]
MQKNHEDKDTDEDPPAGSDQGLKRRKIGKDAKPSKGSKSKESKSSSSKGTKSQPKLSGNTNDQPNVEAALELDWFKKTERPSTLDFDWNARKSVDFRPPQTWISRITQAKNHPLTFDELMSTPTDFSAYIMNNLKIDNLTQEHRVGPTFNLLKGTCRSQVKLEYHFEECYKAVTDRLDWNNPEGQEYPFDLSKPLPLIEDQGRQVVLVGYFIKNDLEYLKGGSSSRKYTTSTTKTNAAKYDDIQDIKDMVPSLWSPVKGITYWGPKQQQFYGYASKRVSKHDVFSTKRIIAKLYKFKEGDFPRLNLRDIEDMLLLLVQKKIANLERDVIFDLNVALRMFTKRYKRNKLMRSDKLYKFSDGTLTSVRSILYDITSNLRMDYLPKRRWSTLDKKEHQSDTKVFTMRMEILPEPTSNKLCGNENGIKVDDMTIAKYLEYEETIKTQDYDDYQPHSAKANVPTRYRDHLSPRHKSPDPSLDAKTNPYFQASQSLNHPKISKTPSKYTREQSDQGLGDWFEAELEKCWKIQQKRNNSHLNLRRQAQNDALRNWEAQIDQLKRQEREVSECKMVHTPKNDMHQKETSQIERISSLHEKPNPGSLTIPCSVDIFNINAIADLGASINIMSKSILEELSLGLNNKTIIFGRPFLANIRAKINVSTIEVSLGIEEDRVKIKVNKQECNFTTAVSEHLNEQPTSQDELSYGADCKTYWCEPDNKLGGQTREKTIKEEQEDLEKCGMTKTRAIIRAMINKLSEEWFSGVSGDMDDLEGIIDYLEPTLYDGFIDHNDEALMCRCVGVIYVSSFTIYFMLTLPKNNTLMGSVPGRWEFRGK